MDDTQKGAGDQVQEPGKEAPGGRGSATEESLSDEKKGKVYTDGEIEEIVNKRHSTLDKKITALEDQLKKSGNTQTENEKLRQHIADLEDKKDAAALEAVKEDPEKIDIVKREQAVRKKEQELADWGEIVDILRDNGFSSPEEVEKALEKTNEANRRELAETLTTEFKGVFTVQDLLKLGSESPEQMRKHAEFLAEKSVKPEDKKDETKETPGKKMKPDSGRGQGSFIDTTGMSPRDMIKAGLSQK